MSDVYLGRRESKKIASGDLVKVRYDGEYIWIDGTDVRSDL